jgi:hypothetical protein
MQITFQISRQFRKEYVLIKFRKEYVSTKNQKHTNLERKRTSNLYKYLIISEMKQGVLKLKIFNS